MDAIVATAVGELAIAGGSRRFAESCMSIADASTSLTITCNGQPRTVAGGMTVAALLAELGLEPRHVAVEVNLELVPRTRHAERMLAADDRIEIVTLVGGG